MKAKHLLEDMTFETAEDYMKPGTELRKKVKTGSNGEYIEIKIFTMVAKDDEGFEREWEVTIDSVGQRKCMPLLLTREGYEHYWMKIYMNYPDDLRNIIDEEFPNLNIRDRVIAARMIRFGDMEANYVRVPLRREIDGMYKKIKDRLHQKLKRKLSLPRLPQDLRDYYELVLQERRRKTK